MEDCKENLKHIAFLTQDRIGDALVNSDNIEALHSIYNPCRITVFTSPILMPFYSAHKVVDKVIEYKGVDTQIPNTAFEAVFSHRYDAESVDVIKKMHHKSAYGYENIDIPEAVCKDIFTKYLPLSIWDDEILRRYTSVTEQGAELIRLVKPDYHCQSINFNDDNFQCDYEEAKKILKSACADTDNIALFVLSGSYKSKRWDAVNYLRINDEIKRLGISTIFLIGDDADDDANWESNTNIISIKCLPLTVIASIAILKRDSAIAIGNDTGVMHLLRACGCRSVTICFCDTYQTWAPYCSDRHIAIHAPCADFHACSSCNGMRTTADDR